MSAVDLLSASVEAGLALAEREFAGGRTKKAFGALGRALNHSRKLPQLRARGLDLLSALRARAAATDAMDEVSPVRALPLCDPARTELFWHAHGDHRLELPDRDQFGAPVALTIAKYCDATVFRDGSVLDRHGRFVPESLPRRIAAELRECNRLLHFVQGWDRHRCAPEIKGAVFSGSTERNFFHFLTETVIPRLLLDLFGAPQRLRTWPCHAESPPAFVAEYLALVGGAVALPAGAQAVRCEQVYLCSLTWKPIGSYSGYANQLFDRLLRLAGARMDGPSTGRLYLSRKGYARALEDEERLFREVLAPRGFELLDPGTLPIAEQMQRFHDAETIVAPHGAALANLGFCRPSARVLELVPPNRALPSTFTQMARGRGCAVYIGFGALAHVGDGRFRVDDLPGFQAALDRLLDPAQGGGVVLMPGAARAGQRG